MPADTFDFGEVFKSTYISPQKPALPLVPEDMKVQLQSNPPLGQVTTVENSIVAFTAVLKIPLLRADEPWQVAMWFSDDDDADDDAEWRETNLVRVPTGDEPMSLQLSTESMAVHYFGTSLSLKSSVRFTLKFRHDESEAWRWIRDEQGLNDGLIVLSSPMTQSPNLSDIIPNIGKEWKSVPRVSQSSRSYLWSLETVIPGSDHDKSSFKDIVIGTPWGSFSRWFALVRLWSPWIAPRQGKQKFAIDKEAVLCSFLSHQGKTVVFLAMSGTNDVTSLFRHTEMGEISVHARNDSTSEKNVVILVGVSDDFDCAVAAVMYHARTFSMRPEDASHEWIKQIESLGVSASTKEEESWYDGLGYCTWNGLGQRLTEEKIIEAVNKLAEHKINITSLIIDDNWQSIDYKGPSQFQYGWMDFEAEPEAFPNGLKAAVSRIREGHPRIKHIAVWHALLGYWGGISPGGKIASTYKTREVDREEGKRRNLPLGGRINVVDKEDVGRFYADFYSFLSNAGVDAVKTDAQFMVDTFTSASDRRELINTYLDVWTASSLRYFGIKTISCMSQFPNALFHSQMPHNRPALLVRNSDDFFPSIPESHPWHIWANAYNSIFMQYLNVLPDWDMFQTVHDYSGFHAAARCVSGGPIYITDVPGEHNIDLIEQMTARTTKNKTVILRPSVLGKSIHPYMGYDDDLLLKVGSYHGASEVGTSILAIFNISQRPLTEMIPLSDFPGTLPAINYVTRAHTTGKVSKPTAIGESNALFTTSLSVRGYEILSAFPATCFNGKNGGQVWISNLGLVGKMTGCAAIVSSRIAQRTNGWTIMSTKLKALGSLGVYISALPTMTVEGNLMVIIEDRPIPVEAVRVSPKDCHVLEVDVERAWAEMGLVSGWKDEVEVHVHLSA